MGASADKLVLGIPTYGRSYTLYNPDANEIGAPADGPGDMGDATRENGYLAYYEVNPNCVSTKTNSTLRFIADMPIRQRKRLGSRPAQHRRDGSLRFQRQPMGWLRRRKHRQEKIAIRCQERVRRHHVLVDRQR